MEKRTKKEIFIVNDYRIIYKPEYHRCMHGNWEGYVYEHIVVAENKLNRKLYKDEVVHHLDNNRGNNRKENLLVLSAKAHTTLHEWLSSGAPGIELFKQKNSNRVKPSYCKCCGVTLQGRQIHCCSRICSDIGSRTHERPSKMTLLHEVNTESMVNVGKKYNVSDNAVRKWLKAYGITKIKRGVYSCTSTG